MVTALVVTRNVKICFNVARNGQVSHPDDILRLTLLPSPPSAAYMRQSTWSALVQIMVCRLFGVKSLPEQMLTYCQLDP